MKKTFSLILFLALSPLAWPQGELRFCLRSDPKTLDPLQVTDESSETVRYLTAGVLLRVNRATQKAEPELAESWQVSADGKTVRFRVRAGVRFSDGTPFDAEDVAATVRRLFDMSLRVPAGESLRRKDKPGTVSTNGPREVTITFPEPIPGVVQHFDEIPILSSRSPLKEKAVLGPFQLAEREVGSHLLFRRNPNYWKKDAKGVRLPYLDSVRLDIQQNREMELTRFRRGELHFISSLDVEAFDRLATDEARKARDAGSTMESEVLWFNQAAASPLPEYKKKWFRSQAFRRAVSGSIRRDDLVKLVYKGHAAPGFGPLPPASRIWSHPGLKPHAFDPAGALKKLSAEGFAQRNGTLHDASGNAVEFSIVTNSGNKNRARMGALIQQDLAKIGIKVNLVTLDFPSLIERITRTFQYEGILLSITGVDSDPNDQMNVWLSSSSNHGWNPKQPKPETAWEAEIDKLMLEQSELADVKKRQTLVRRFQEIVWEQAPMIYLVHPNALVAVSPELRNAVPVAFRPRVHWNVEHLQLIGAVSQKR